MNWPASLLLATVLWLDGGLRKVPASSIVMRRTLFAPWKIIEIVRAEGWRALGRWPSLALTLVSSEPAKVRSSFRQLDERLQRVRFFVLALRMLGLTTSLALVFGAPIAVERYGRAGLFYSADILLTLGLLTAILCVFAARRLDARGWAPIQFSASYLWPFSGPYAAERVLALAAAGASPLDVARTLAGAETFARWARPFAYDALADRAAREPRLVEEFDFHLPRIKLEKLLAVLPPNTPSGGHYCPRCGSSFQSDVRDCSDCGVTLSIAELKDPETPPAAAS